MWTRGSSHKKHPKVLWEERGGVWLPTPQTVYFLPTFTTAVYIMWTRGSGPRKHPEVLWEEKGGIRRESRACGRRRYKKEGEEKGWRVVRGGSSWLHRRLKEGRGKKATQTTECLCSCQNPLMAVLKRGGRMCQTSGPLED